MLTSCAGQTRRDRYLHCFEWLACRKQCGCQCFRCLRLSPSTDLWDIIYSVGMPKTSHMITYMFPSHPLFQSILTETMTASMFTPHPFDTASMSKRCVPIASISQSSQARTMIMSMGSSHPFNKASRHPGRNDHTSMYSSHRLPRPCPKTASMLPSRRHTRAPGP